MWLNEKTGKKKITDEDVLAELDDGVFELLETAKAKRFAMSRIKRVLMNVLIKNNLPKDLAPSYLRVLALSDTGAVYLKENKDNMALPVITKPAAYKEKDIIFELELFIEAAPAFSFHPPQLLLSPALPV